MTKIGLYYAKFLMIWLHLFVVFCVFVLLDFKWGFVGGFGYLCWDLTSRFSPLAKACFSLSS